MILYHSHLQSEKWGEVAESSSLCCSDGPATWSGAPGGFQGPSNGLQGPPSQPAHDRRARESTAECVFKAKGLEWAQEQGAAPGQERRPKPGF